MRNKLSKIKKLAFALAAMFVLLSPSFASAARTDALWDYIQGGNYTKPNGSANGTDILIYGINHYINFGTLTGTNGYGFRDNAGTMEFKNSGGAWAAFGSGGGSGTVTSVALTAPTGLSVSGSPVTTNGTLALSLTAGYNIPLTASTTDWNTAYLNRITSLTTSGSSGVATLISNVLNIPQYQAAGTYMTSITVASTNGFAGSSSGGATPALTLSTTISGLLKGNGTAISAAANGTDYTLITAKTCTAGDFVSAVTAAGVFTCTTPSGTTYTGTYPVQVTGSVISLAFGTTSSNTWGGTQTFTNSPVFSTLGAGTLNATSAGTLYSTGTSTPTLAAEFTYGGTLGQFIGGASGALSLTTNGTALSKIVQIGANTILGNPTGATGNVTAFATSSLGIALSDTSGTLQVARGGTGQVSFAAGNLVYGAGSGALQSIATSTATCTSASGITCTSFAFVGTGGSTIALSSIPNTSLANSTISGVALGGTLAALTATDSTLTFSGSYTGTTARTIGINLTQPNTWTGLQQFNGNASTTGFTNSGQTWLTALGTPAGAFLAVDPTGKIIATTTPTGSGGLTGTTGQVAYFSGTNTAVGTSTIFISSAQNVGLGTSTPPSALDVEGTYSPVSVNFPLGTSNGINVSQVTSGLVASSSDTGAATGNIAANTFYSVFNPSASAASQFFYGQYNLTTVPSGNTVSLSAGTQVYGSALLANDNSQGTAALDSLIGFSGLAQSRSINHTITNMEGMSAAATIANQAGQYSTTTNAYGVISKVSNLSANGLITNAYGYQASLANTGTITNTFGFYATGMVAGTQTNKAYDFYGADTGAYNYFGGNVGLSTTSPYAALSLGGGNLVLGAATAGGTPGDLFLPKLGTAAGAFLAVDASGKVIATTTPSGGGGAVSSVSNADGTLTISPTTGAVVASLNLGSANTWSALQQFNGNASTTQLTTTGNAYLAATGGNVGVGTTTPFGTLSINAAAQTNPYFVIGSSTGQVFSISPSTNPLFGIGTSSPMAAFSVLVTSSIAEAIGQVISGTTYLTQVIDSLGHLKTGGPSPIVTTCTGFSIAGDDRSGIVTMTSGTTCSFSFANAYPVAPACAIGPQTTVTTIKMTTTTTGIAVQFGTAQTSFSYICQYHQ